MFLASFLVASSRPVRFGKVRRCEGDHQIENRSLLCIRAVLQNPVRPRDRASNAVEGCGGVGDKADEVGFGDGTILESKLVLLRITYTVVLDGVASMLFLYYVRLT